MQRRDFLNTATVGAVVAGTSGLTSCIGLRPDKNGSQSIQKAIWGMLCVQRRSWEQGVCAQALLESGQDDLALLLAEEAVLRQDSLGRLANVASENSVTDPASNGEPVIFAYSKTKEEKYRIAAGRMLKYLMEAAPRTSDKVLHHITSAPQVWVDSMYMAPPFLAVAGEPVEAMKQVEGIRKYLWNEKARLFSHMWDDGIQDFARKDFWGVGNGWAAAGMTRVLKALPENMEPEKERLKGYIAEVVEGCLRHLRQDGLFHNIVDNAETFIETNLSQMLSYTIYQGVSGGWIDHTLIDKAEIMRNAAWAKQDKRGMIEDVCGSPNFDRPGTAAEGQAFFLLMESARQKYQSRA